MDINSYLTHVCQHCGLDESEIKIEIDESPEDAVEIQLNVPEEDVGLFIGHHGENLASLQRLVRIVFYEKYPEKKLRVNINDYREERLKQLQEKAQEIGHYVLESQKPYQFPFLSSYERFIIHSALSEDEAFAGLESASEGEGKQRRLVVRPKN